MCDPIIYYHICFLEDMCSRRHVIQEAYVTRLMNSLNGLIIVPIYCIYMEMSNGLGSVCFDGELQSGTHLSQLLSFRPSHG